MVKMTIFVLIFMLTTVVIGGEVVIPPRQQTSSAWVKEWWENAYQLSVRKDIDREDTVLCYSMLRQYTNKVKERPTSEYYQLKLDKWIGRCKDKTIDMSTK